MHLTVDLNWFVVEAWPFGSELIIDEPHITVAEHWLLVQVVCFGHGRHSCLKGWTCTQT